MVKIFIMWVTIQLVVIGYSTLDMLNQVDSNTYKCPKTEYVPPLLGALFPLTAFVQDNQITDYCKNNSTTN